MELTDLSPTSTVVLAVCAVSWLTILYRTLTFTVSVVVAAVKAIAPARRKRKAAPVAGSAPGSAAAPAKPPGVSLKELMRHQKMSGDRGGGPDRHADSELFIATLRGHTDAVTGVAFSADGRALATACEDRTLRVYDTSDPFAKTLPFRVGALRKGMLGVAFGADARRVAVLTEGAANAAGVCLVDMSPKEPQVVWEAEGIFAGRVTPGLCLRGSSAGGGGAPVVVAAAATPELVVYAAAAGRCERLGRIDTGGITNYNAAVSRDGRFVAAATFTPDVKLYEVEYDRVGSFLGLKKVMDLKGHRSKVLTLDFSPDGKKAVTASADGTLIVWNIDVRYKQQEDPKKLVSAGLALPKGQCYSRLAWGPGGHIAAAHGRTVHLLDCRSGERVDAIREAHAGDVVDMAWAPARVLGPQGKVAVLATAGRDSRVRLWRGPLLVV